MNEPELVLSERVGEIAILRLNLPARLNPISIPLQTELRRKLAALREDRSARALVLTGTGRAFCVGADLSSMTVDDAFGPGLGERTADMMHNLTNRIVEDLQTLPIPVVAAVNGATAGAGVGLALAADIVVAARSAYFYLPFMPRLGIVPDVGVAWHLERILGRARSVALSLLGDRLPAEQAVQWGLIHACVADAEVMDEALRLAAKLAALPDHAALETRALFDAAASQPLLAQLAYEAERQRVLIERSAFAEGVKAFGEKRDPDFRML